MKVVVDGDLADSVIALWNYIDFFILIFIYVRLQRKYFVGLKGLIWAHSLGHGRQCLRHYSLSCNLFSLNKLLFLRVNFIVMAVHMRYRSFSSSSFTHELITNAFLTRWLVANASAQRAFSLSVTTCYIAFCWGHINWISHVSVGWFLRNVLVQGSIPRTITI